MRKAILLFLLVFTLIVFSGCSSAFWGGAASGVAGTGVGYEYKAKHEMDLLEEEYKAGNITQEEYEARKEQIRRMSITQ